MSAKELVDKLTPPQREKFAEQFLMVYLNSSLGALPKTEIDLLVFRLLLDAGVAKPGETQYEIARLFNLTPAQVRTLIFRKQLRDPAQDEAELTKRLRGCLSVTRFSKDGAQVVFGVEDPLLQAYIVATLKRLNSTPDFSFNRELLRIPIDPFTDLLDSLIDEKQRNIAKAALNKAGFPGGDLKSVLRGALRVVAGKLADKAGEKLADHLFDEATKLLGPALQVMFDSPLGGISEQWSRLKGLFEPAQQGDASSTVSV